MGHFFHLIKVCSSDSDSTLAQRVSLLSNLPPRAQDNMPVYRRKKDRKARMAPTRYTPPKKRRQAYKKSNILTSGTNPANHVIHRGIGFPDKFTTNLVYTDSFVLDPSASTICPSKRFRWANLYDPDYETGGGQPTYYDQLAAMYGRYIVNGAKMTVIFSRMTGTAAGIGPYICGVLTTDSSTTSLPTTDAGTLISLPNCSFAVVNDQDGSKTVTATYSRLKWTDSSLDAYPTTATSSYALAHIFASPQGTDVEAPINVVVVMEFNATFMESKSVIDA